MKLWQYEGIDYIILAKKQPSHHYFEMPTMYEDELLDDIFKEGAVLTSVEPDLEKMGFCPKVRNSSVWL